MSQRETIPREPNAADKNQWKKDGQYLNHGIQVVGAEEVRGKNISIQDWTMGANNSWEKPQDGGLRAKASGFQGNTIEIEEGVVTVPGGGRK